MPRIILVPTLITVSEFSLCIIVVSESQFHIHFFKKGSLILISLCSVVHQFKRQFAHLEEHHSEKEKEVLHCKESMLLYQGT
jgi:hypothetical protein